MIAALLLMLADGPVDIGEGEMLRKTAYFQTSQMAYGIATMVFDQSYTVETFYRANCRTGKVEVRSMWAMRAGQPKRKIAGAEQLPVESPQALRIAGALC